MQWVLKSYRGKRVRCFRCGLTMIELLVVTAIISLLMSLLFPALSAALRQAASTRCQANLRTLGQAMIVYTQDHNGHLPGSALTSAAHLWFDNAGNLAVKGEYSIHNVPGPIEFYDYVAPLAGILRLKLPDAPDGMSRLRAYREMPLLLCPANVGVTATLSAGPPGLEDGQMLSYCTGAAFMLGPFRGSHATEYSGAAGLPGTPYWDAPPGYSPHIARLGNPARKIFLADSGRWSRYNSKPTFSYARIDQDHNSTLFSDFGPFWGISKSYDRSVPNNLNNAAIDARIYAYRHGRREQFLPSGAYRLNAVFYDGHVQSLDDMSSADPELWLPSGSTIAKPTAKFSTGLPIVYEDVRQRYLPTASPTSPYVAP